MTMLRVACVQLSSGDDVAANVAAASQLIRQAQREGAQFVLTPEMTSFMDVRPGALEAKTQSETSHDALEAFRGAGARTVAVAADRLHVDPGAERAKAPTAPS